MRKLLRCLGIGLVLAGLTLGGFTFFQKWHAERAYSSTQGQLAKQLQQEQSAVHQATKPVPKKTSKVVIPHEGDAFAVLKIPRFGSGYHPVIVEGIAKKDLVKGPGHYSGTALPGQIGNFAVAGHRTGWGQPFERLNELKRGDAITITWQGRSYTYHVTKIKVVKPSDVGVVLPVPNEPGKKPDKARITLTTCTPKWVNTHRLIVWGELDKN